LAGVLYPIFIYQFSDVAQYAEFNARLNSVFPADWSLAMKMAASSVPLLCVSAFCASQIQRRHEGGIWNLLSSHRPVAIILGGTSALALFSIVVGTPMMNFVILTHFTGWFIFATTGISKQPKEVQQSITWRTPNEWIRRNMVGFWVFHGGLAALFFGLIAVNHWVLAQQPMTIGGKTFPNVLTILFCRDSLYYWTIVHVTMGFLPKPAPKRR
jgi:hypothetical protein